MKESPQFILASASPRRRLLLEKAGYRFDTVPSDVDESSFETEGISCAEHTRQLALAKAYDIASRLPDRIVLGADTVVKFAGAVVGKPADAADAERITRMLFSAPHEVITGIALVGMADSIRIVEADTTIVYPKKLTDEQILRHIESGDWRGKAGAYGIQESGDEFVERIDGSFTNVMGLPMDLVTRMLENVGIRPRRA